MAKSHLDHYNEDLRGENFSKYKLDFTGANFSYAKLQGADFTGVTLRNANFTHAKLEGAKFCKANLQGADFTQASVDADSSSKGVDFSSTQIQGANFTKSVLHHANFHKAEAGLTRLWCWVVIISSLAICLVSGFTAAIASTFVVHFFFTSSQKASVPGQKPSFLVLLPIWLWSVGLIISFRIILNNCFNPDAVLWHVGIGITLILIFLVLVPLITNEKADANSLLWITLITLSPLLLPHVIKIQEVETWLANTVPFLADHIIKGLGSKPSNSFTWIFPVSEVNKPTNGAFLTGVFGAAVGAFFGCWFSRLAIPGDEKFDWLWKIYLKFVTIGGTHFNQANLTNAVFTLSNLKGTGFKGASIAKVRWDQARYLDCVLIGRNSYLKYPKIRQLVVTRKWEGENNFDGLDISGINLEEADLNDASFVSTNLSQANLQGAKLMRANLKKANLDGADLTKAHLTGACIQAWSTDEKTLLSNINCEYVFLKDVPDPKTGIQERLPDAAGTGFESGDFETLFKKDNATIQLFIRNSDDRQALSIAFQQLIKETDFVFQGFEIIGNNALVKIRVPQRINKSATSNKFYQTLRQAEESKKDSDLKEYKDQPWYEFVLNLVKVIMSGTSNFDFRGATVGNVANNVMGDQNSIQHIYTPEQRQTLSEAAEKIQRLLKDLEQTKPTATEAEQVAYVNDRTTHSLKSRVVGALQASSETAIDEFILEDKYLKVAKAAIKGWLQPGS